MTTHQPEIRKFGLLIRRYKSYGTSRVDVYVTSRKESEGMSPLGCGDDCFTWERPKHLAKYALDGLGMYGFVSDYADKAFIGDAVEYRDVFAIDQRRADKMLKTLRRINARLAMHEAREPGDKFQVLADFLRADFVVEDRQNDLPKNGERWRWMSVAEGRNRYRQLIEESRAIKQPEQESAA